MKKDVLRLYDKKKQKEVVVGHIKDDTFFKTVKANHYMIKYQGYGIDKRVLSYLFAEKLSVEYIIIQTKLQKYKSKLIDWLEKGIEGDFGHGTQLFLPVSLMNKI